MWSHQASFALVNKSGRYSLEYKLTFRDRGRGWCLILACFLSSLWKQNPAKQFTPFPKVGTVSSFSLPKYFLWPGNTPHAIAVRHWCALNPLEKVSPEYQTDAEPWRLTTEVHNNSRLLCLCCSKFPHKQAYFRQWPWVILISTPEVRNR